MLMHSSRFRDRTRPASTVSAGRRGSDRRRGARWLPYAPAPGLCHDKGWGYICPWRCVMTAPGLPGAEVQDLRGRPSATAQRGRRTVGGGVADGDGADRLVLLGDAERLAKGRDLRPGRSEGEIEGAQSGIDRCQQDEQGRE